MELLLRSLCSSIPLTGKVTSEILHLILLEVFVRSRKTHTSPELLNVVLSDKDCCAYLVGFKELKKQSRH